MGHEALPNAYPASTDAQEAAVDALSAAADGSRYAAILPARGEDDLQWAASAVLYLADPYALDFYDLLDMSDQQEDAHPDSALMSAASALLNEAEAEHGALYVDPEDGVSRFQGFLGGQDALVVDLDAYEYALLSEIGEGN